MRNAQDYYRIYGSVVCIIFDGAIDPSAELGKSFPNWYNREWKKRTRHFWPWD
jgi:hypothetical protein